MAAARLADAWSAARRTLSGARAQTPRSGGVVLSEGANSEPHMSQAGAKAGQEPTMEDILASIRRIIAEDYAAQAAPAPQPHMVPQTQNVARPQSAPTYSRPTGSPAQQMDPLELNARAERFRPPMPEVVAVTPPSAMSMSRAPLAQSVAQAPLTHGNAARAVSEFSERLGRSFAAAERYQREAQSVEPVAVSAEQPALVSDTNAMADAQPAPVMSATVEAVAAAVQSHLEAAIQAAHRTEAPRIPEPSKPVDLPKEAPVSLRPEPASLRSAIEARAAQVARESATPAPDRARESALQSDSLLKNDPPPSWLVSPRTTNAVAGSFKALQETKPTAAPVPLSDTQSSALQEVMTAALRPMLKEWLEQHLPGMVERMITAEIQRVTRGE